MKRRMGMGLRMELRMGLRLKMGLRLRMGLGLRLRLETEVRTELEPGPAKAGGWRAMKYREARAGVALRWNAKRDSWRLQEQGCGRRARRRCLTLAVIPIMVAAPNKEATPGARLSSSKLRSVPRKLATPPQRARHSRTYSATPVATSRNGA